MINIDFGKITGKIKPLHGINNSPVNLYEPHIELQQAGIPYVRLHDTAGAYGGTHYVDIPNVFPDFSADPENPENYDFKFTDAYLKQLIASGIKIFYRLGVTIENDYKIKAYHINPPADFDHWAKICAGVIRHYNEGWADGFFYNIEYWEIWNEPENPPMWSGTREQYFELYKTTSLYLKKMFPNIKIGGYAGCGFYSITRPDTSDFYRSFLTFFDDFLQFIQANKLPFDFYSWHLYTDDPHEIITHADYVDSKLVQYGYSQTESIFDEWNCTKSGDTFNLMKEAPGASFVAAAFCLMQKSGINKAMYYDALPSRCYCGLYYFPGQKVTKTYCAFKFFNELFKLKNEVSSSSDHADIQVCAAHDGKEYAVLLVNCTPTAQKVKLQIAGTSAKFNLQIIDENNFWTPESILGGQELTLSPYSIFLLKSEAIEIITHVNKKMSINGIDEQ